ncbi:MAG: hypothetical protein IK076_00555, partial [Bacteroidales bacterium]|nr:hypothetical protein [Bacteroidales bacterium]
TWFEPGKAFFTYLSRCQMMLRQGVLEDRNHDMIHRKTADADIYFAVNQGDDSLEVSLAPADPSCRPELWDPYTGVISSAPSGEDIDSVRVVLAPWSSMFVVFNHGKSDYRKAPAYKLTTIGSRTLDDVWEVSFLPKMDDPFSVGSFRLQDFSLSDEDRLKYFSGTATYSKTVTIGKDDLSGGRRIIIDLGELEDIAELKVNGRKVAVLWHPPFKADITDFVNAGDNRVEVAVTTNWANRLIGDEQYEPDFEWGEDRGAEMGRAMKDFPEWFLKEGHRPSVDRKAFVIWSYFRKDSPLQPAGLVGPVRLDVQEADER